MHLTLASFLSKRVSMCTNEEIKLDFFQSNLFQKLYMLHNSTKNIWEVLRDRLQILLKILSLFKQINFHSP